jgi:hypothetical protein
MKKDAVSLRNSHYFCLVQAFVDICKIKVTPCCIGICLLGLCRNAQHSQAIEVQLTAESKALLLHSALHLKVAHCGRKR